MAWVRPKFLNFIIFYKRDPSKNWALAAFGLMQLFDPTHPEGPTGTPGSLEVRKSKVKFGVFFIEGNPTKSNSNNILFFSNFSFDAALRLYKAVKILKKGVRFQVCKIKIRNFGAVHKTRLEGYHQSLTFGLMELFDMTQSRGPTGSSKLSKKRQIPGLLNKSWEFGGYA